MTEPLQLRVVKIEDQDRIRSIVFQSANGSQLPVGGPGSHIVVSAGEHANAYSLTDAPSRRNEYSISVQHEPAGAGGSEWIHTRLSLGDILEARRPRNLFAPVLSSRRNIYVAGGIGVTPLIAHMRESHRAGVPFEFALGVRDGSRVPMFAEVHPLAGPNLTVLEGPETLLAHLETRLRQQPIGTYLFTCGPSAMMDAVCALARSLGWPDQRIRTELFAAPRTAQTPFTACLSRSGREIQVPANQSLLTSLTQAGVPVPSLCRHGVCGECRLPVISGQLDHRDLYLSAEEREAGDVIVSCVSRADNRLELDV